MGERDVSKSRDDNGHCGRNTIPRQNLHPHSQVKIFGAGRYFYFHQLDKRTEDSTFSTQDKTIYCQHLWNAVE